MFMLKKIIGSLIMPLPLAMLLVVLGFVLLWRVAGKTGGQGSSESTRGGQRKAGMTLLVSGFLIIYLAGNGTISRWLIAPLEQVHPPYAGQPISAVLVLGSYHRSAPGLPVTSYLENDALYRLAEGIRIALEHEEIPLVLSGYNFNDEMSQAEAYRQVALSLGFPEQRILLLESGRDTSEEMQGMKNIIGNQSFALVTSAYHMARSMASAKRYSLQPVAAPTWHKVKPSEDSEIDLWTFVPSPKALMISSRALHEYLGLSWYWLTDRL